MRVFVEIWIHRDKIKQNCHYHIRIKFVIRAYLTFLSFPKKKIILTLQLQINELHKYISSKTIDGIIPNFAVVIWIINHWMKLYNYNQIGELTFKTYTHLLINPILQWREHNLNFKQ